MIGLARIDRLDLLTLLPLPVLVTTEVWHEIVVDPAKPGVVEVQKAREAGLLAVVEEGDPRAFPHLDPGESTVLSAAAATHATVLIDERKARVLIDTDPDLQGHIRDAIGIVGLMLLAKRREYIEEVRPLLDALRRANFCLSPQFYQAVLEQAGEG